MANMYPYPIINFKNEPENLIFNKLRENLSSDYSVLYGRSWVNRSNNSNSDIECDFIITKPESGILVLEVKGGTWERINGEWLCYGKSVKQVDDPFIQAKNNKYALINFLKLNWADRFFPVEYAIAIPDTRLKLDTDKSGLPNILTYDELDYIDEWVERAMEDCLQKNFPHKTDNKLVGYMVELLMKNYVVKLSDILEKTEKELLILTEQELNLDNKLKRQKRLTIQGCAGSGKTLMAIRQVKRLAKEQKVKKILFTCFNRELSQWLQNNTDSIRDQCTVIPFLDYCEKHAIAKGTIRENDKNDPDYYKKIPEAFLLATDAQTMEKFDAIVVDEGQSFKELWWDLLESMLIEKDSSYFYIFYDHFQRIYQEVINPVPREQEAIELNINVRNTARIHAIATAFLPKENLPDCNNIEGDPVWLHYYTNEPGKENRNGIELFPMKRVLRKLFHEIIQVGGVSSKDIIILTPEKSKSAFLPNEQIGSYKLLPLESEGNNFIRYSTIQSFRGMERKVVIVAEIDGKKLEEIKTLLYMGCSRAKTKLIIMLSTDVEPEISEVLAKYSEDITGKI